MFLALKQQIFKKIHMEVDIKENKDLELESRFSFQINYNEDNSTCIAHLHQEVRNRGTSNEFSVLVEGLGYFLCEGIETDDDKRNAHVQAYMLLFPYVQNMIAQLSKDAGLPPFMIDMAKMKPEDVELGTKS